MDSNLKTVAVIGAGPSGLVSAKEANESGLIPTVFEKASDLGGLWNPKTGYTWDSMHTNLSKYTCMFSDFPWPDEIEDFPSSLEICKYLRSYAENFGILQNISFDTKVIKVQKSNEKWSVTTRMKDNEEKTEGFDFVIFACGIFQIPYFPKCLSQSSEKVIHSSYYKSPEAFKDKKVVVVGGSLSGVEIASDISQSAATVTHIIREPHWIIPKYFPHKEKGKIPLDLSLYIRPPKNAPQLTPKERSIKYHNYFKGISDQDKIDSLKITSYDTPLKVAISEGYVNAVQNNKITVDKREIKDLDGNHVNFEDGSSIEADFIIACTGYTTSLPLLDTEILEKIGFDPEDKFLSLILYKNTIPPLEIGNMAFVGMYRGPYFGVMELQARLAIRHFCGHLVIENEDMKKGLDEELALRNLRPRPQYPHTYVPIADDIAKTLGVFPDVDSDELKSDEVCEMLIKGPVLPSHYRLVGEGKKPDLAKKIISEVYKRLQ